MQQVVKRYVVSMFIIWFISSAVGFTVGYIGFTSGYSLWIMIPATLAITYVISFFTAYRYYHSKLFGLL